MSSAAVAHAAQAQAPAAPASWKLVAAEDFTGSALGPRWGAYGGAYGIGANAWSPADVSVSGGQLHVRLERRATGGKPFTSGGAAMWGFAQTYGRYEFQAEAPTTPGIDSYVTLWPPDSDSDADATLVELLAKPAAAPGQEAAYVTIGYGGGKENATVPGRYTGAFHSYVIEWTPDHESVSVDGKMLLTSHSVTRARRWIGFITSTGDALTGTPGASAALPAEFLVEHLRVYAYAPGGAQGTAASASPAPASAPPSTAPAAASLTAAAPSVAGPSHSAAAVVQSSGAAPNGAVATGPAADARSRSSPTLPLIAALAIAVSAIVAGLVLHRRRTAVAVGGQHRRDA